jgi:hypothetical protein
VSLPNSDRAIVEEHKIRQYLLNPAHPDNGGKATFFADVGFTADGWGVLADSLRAMARNAPVSSRADSVHGEKFVLEGEIPTPSGKTPRVRSVWIVDRGSDAPRLVTAYPVS